MIFFFIGPNNSDKCGQDLSRFLSLVYDIGVPIKHEKTEQPSTKNVIYGIEIDYIAMENRLPEEKLSKVGEKLNDIAR